MPGVESAQRGAGGHVLKTRDQQATTGALIEAAHRAGVAIQSLTIKGNSLDDVFMQYTGTDLRDSVDDKRRTVRVLQHGPQA